MRMIARLFAALLALALCVGNGLSATNSTALTTAWTLISSSAILVQGQSGGAIIAVGSSPPAVNAPGFLPNQSNVLYQIAPNSGDNIYARAGDSTATLVWSPISAPSNSVIAGTYGTAGAPASLVGSVQGINGGTAVNAALNDNVTSLTPTITASIYVANQSMGGLQTFAVANGAKFSGKITQLMMTSLSGATTPTGKAYIFSRIPASTCTDHVAFGTAGVIAAADAPYLVAAFDIPITAPDTQILSVTGAGRVFKFLPTAGVPSPLDFTNRDITPGANVYVCVVALAAFITPSTATDLTFSLGFSGNY
jgi:hypothetical protein